MHTPVILLVYLSPENDSFESQLVDVFITK